MLKRRTSRGKRSGTMIPPAAMSITCFISCATALFPSLSGMKGRYLENAIYDADEKRAAEFDRHFPARETVTGTPSQQRFQKVVAMRKRADAVSSEAENP